MKYFVIPYSWPKILRIENGFSKHDLSFKAYLSNESIQVPLSLDALSQSVRPPLPTPKVKTVFSKSIKINFIKLNSLIENPGWIIRK